MLPPHVGGVTHRGQGGAELDALLARALIDQLGELLPREQLGGGEAQLGRVVQRVLRDALADVSRDDLDTALRELDRARDVDLIPEENQKTLTPADRAAAVVVGVDHHHLLRIAP